MSTFLTRTSYRPEDLEKQIPVNITQAETPFTNHTGYSSSSVNFNSTAYQPVGNHVSNTYGTGPFTEVERRYVDALHANVPRPTSFVNDHASMLGGGHPSAYIADFYQNPRWSYLGGGPDQSYARSLQMPSYGGADFAYSSARASGTSLSLSTSGSSLYSSGSGISMNVGVSGRSLPAAWEPYAGLSGNGLQATLNFKTPFGLKEPSKTPFVPFTSWEETALKYYYW